LLVAVLRANLREKLPDEFQTAEDLLHHGFVDAIVPHSAEENPGTADQLAPTRPEYFSSAGGRQCL